MLEALLNDYKYPHKNTLTSIAEIVLFPTRTLFGYRTVQYDPSNQEFKEEDQKCNNVFFRILMLPVSIVLIPITVIACIVKALDSEVKKVHGLFLSEKNLKPYFKGMVEIHDVVTGYIGTDRKYQFSNRIKLMSGEKLKITPDDFYLSVTINSVNSKSEYVFPSSLFTQAKKGNQVRFYFDDKLYDLRMKEGMEDQIKEIHENLKEDPLLDLGFYQYEKDIPPNYFKWFFYAHWHIYLSPEAKRIRTDAPGILPVNFQQLSRATPTLTAAEAYYNESDLLFNINVSGFHKDEIDIIFDKHTLYVYAYHRKEKQMSEYQQFGESKISERICCFCNIVRSKIDPKSLDFEKTSTKIEDGILTIQLFAKK